MIPRKIKRLPWIYSGKILCTTKTIRTFDGHVTFHWLLNSSRVDILGTNFVNTFLSEILRNFHDQPAWGVHQNKIRLNEKVLLMRNMFLTFKTSCRYLSAKACYFKCKIYPYIYRIRCTMQDAGCRRIVTCAVQCAEVGQNTNCNILFSVCQLYWTAHFFF